MKRDVFQALADPTRRAILLSLREKDSNVNGLAEQLDMTRQAVSLHVRYLEECGVISVKKEGRNRLCQLEEMELAKVNKWLEPFKELWNKRYNQLDDLLTEMQ
jgi:DNA-binding transcriptional ArsR family regulator